MIQEAVRLEVLRQAIQDAEYAAGSMYDYLDRGRPDEQQRQEAWAEIARSERRSAELKQQFHELLVALRATAPQAIEQWVGWHVSICKRIIAESERGGPDQSVRLYVARETLGEWEKVLSGAEDFVYINSYFLRDYNEEVAAITRGQS